MGSWIGKGSKLSEKVRSHLVTGILRAYASDSVGDVHVMLRNTRLESTEAIYIVTRGGKLLGCILLAELLQWPDQQVLGLIMNLDPPAVRPDDDQETAANLAVDRGLAAVPVVDDAGILQGVVPAMAIIHILRREHSEDLLRFTGILNAGANAAQALEAAPLRRAAQRLPWLLIGLLGSLFATLIMAGLEASMQRQMAIAFFVPGLIYLADAIGTQTEAIAVRGLSFSSNSFNRLLVGEMFTGLLLGVTIALLTFPLVWGFFGDVRLALAVSTSLVAAGCSATSVGILFPYLIGRFGYDPAYGSGPLATIFQDIFSLLVYLVVVRFLLG